MAAPRKTTAVAGRGLEHVERLASLYRPEDRSAPGARRKAPYWSEVTERSLRDTWHNVIAYAGRDGFERARRRRAAHGPGSALVLPFGDDPAGLRWPPVRSAVLIDAREIDRDTAERWSRALVRDGCAGAYVVLDCASLSVRREGES